MNRNYLKSFLIGLTLALLLVFAREISATDWYVSPGQSIQAAIEAADPGDTIIVAKGTYTGNVLVNENVTLQSAKKHRAIIVGSIYSGDAIRITAGGATVEGFHVRIAEAHDGIAVKANEVIVRGNKVTGPGPFTGWVAPKGAGISVMDCDLVMIMENDVRYTDGVGIYISGTTNSLFVENKVERTQYDGINIWWYSYGNLIAKNNVKKCGTEWNGSAGIKLGGNAHDNIVWDNHVDHSSQSGIRARGNGNQDNTIIGNKMEGHPGPLGGFDAYDETSGSGTAGTANWWVDNKGKTESPIGLLK